MDITKPPKPGRLEGLDFARFLAFAGMVIVNFKVVMGAESSEGLSDLLSGALEGRAAATFVVLAGLGIGLASIRGDYNQTVTLTVKRALFLFVLGLLNTIVFSADILHYYAVYFVIGVGMLRFQSRHLIAIIVLLNVMFIVMLLVFDYDVGWNWDDYSYSGFWTPSGFVRNLFFNGWHPVIPWLGFLLFGFVLSRLALTQVSTQHRLVLIGASVMVAAEVYSRLIVDMLSAIHPELGIFASTDPVPPMPLYIAAGCGCAAAVIGVCLRFTNYFKRTGLLRIIAPAGRQTLTLYIAHIVVGMGTLEAFGLLGEQSATRAVVAAIVFCVVAVLYSLIWSNFFARGPIETIMRKTTG